MPLYAKPHVKQSTQKKLSLEYLLFYIVVVASPTLALVIIFAAVLPTNTLKAVEAGQLPAPALQSAVAVQDPAPAQLNAASSAPQGAAKNPATSATGGNADGDNPFNPPAAEQGGICIEGNIIDVYVQPRGGAGWKVIVTPESPAGAPPVRQVTASPSGDFSTLPDGPLSAGIYIVELNFPDGWQPFTPAAFKVTLNGNPSSGCAHVRFKMEALPSLIATKLDKGGSAGFGEMLGIPNWKITASPLDIRATSTRTVSSAVTEMTDGQGKAYFRNLAPGVWTITEGTEVGWEPVPGYPTAIKINLDSPREPGLYQSLTFVNEQVCGSFIRVVKKDLRGQPLQGWKMKLTHKDGTQIDQNGLTGSDGVVYFTCLPLGDWTVTEEVPAPWWRAVGDTQQTVSLDQPGIGKEVTFVNESLGCVDGYKINHLGQGLSGWQIKAHNTSTNEELSATTDADGYFQFFLRLGTWTLSEVMQEGWSAVTSPEFTVTVTQPFACEHVRFKNRTDSACVDVYKKDHYDDSGLPGWQITLQPAYGGVAQTGVTDGTGWVRFNKLPPGTYILSESMQPGWAPVSPASTTITMEANGRCAVVTFYNRQTNRPATASSSSRPASDRTSACITYYTIQPGNTLYRIALNFGVPLQRLKEVNNLTTNLIYSGMVLCIPDP